MTIPQLISSVGWFIFTFGVAVLVLLTVNLAVPGIDFLISTSHLGILPYLLAVPVTVVGLILGVIGFFAEQIEEWWLNENRHD